MTIKPRKTPATQASKLLQSFNSIRITILQKDPKPYGIPWLQQHIVSISKLSNIIILLSRLYKNFSLSLLYHEISPDLNNYFLL